MPINVTMPALSPTMEEGTLAKWLVAEGDTVSAGDVIAEIETDKATMEVEAVDEGVVGKILVAEGTEGVKVNAVIMVLLEEGEDASAVTETPAASPAPSLPSETPTAEAAPAEVKPAAAPAPAAEGARVFASPLARRIAADKGIDLSAVTGSGPRGRIVKADVETFVPAAVDTPAPSPAAAAPQMATAPAGPSADVVAKMYADRETREIKLDGMRRTIATRLGEAKATIPHFYLRRDIELDTLLSVRKQMNAQGAEQGFKLSVNDFIIKACAAALQRVPQANAVWAGDRIIELVPSDVAVAVAIEGGLFTPVIRDANAKGLAQISTEMKDLATRARERKLAPQEYQGGSFAISNLGMYGIDNFDAVINPPHGSILAVGAGAQKPVVKGGELAVATVMSVTLSVDHRVIDGALGAEFLAAIKANLEDPMMMLV